MGTTDKSDKPVEDQVDQETATAEEVDGVHDAEIVEELAAEDVEDAVAPDATPLEVEEPSEAPQDSDVEAEDGLEVDPEEDEPSVEDVSELPSEDIETPVAASPQQEPAQKTGFVPLVLGGVIAAAIGFGGAVFFGDQLGLGADTEAMMAELRSELAAQKQDLIAADGANTTAAGAAQEAADAAVAQISRISDMLATHTADLGTVSEAVATFDARLTDIEKRPLNEGLGAAAIAAYEREVKDLKELVSAQKAEAADLKDKADLSAKAALARASVARIVAALESGSGYRAAVVDLKSSTGEDVVPVLEAHADDGVVTLTALIESYPDAARSALAKARTDKVDEGAGNKLGNFLKTQFGARSVEARDGTDTDAILSRAEAALKAGDLAAALSELETLAEGPKGVMSEWVSQAQTRADATKAAEELAQTQNSN
ncbi:hypothetical protein NBRC116594_21040 [Shimia sp. NS0008-38b]|uniref:COG4223 family protein n=1 Tax=Shimia sp. NS0008-38b TaxID=3127653 RepID=UPI00310C02CA